MRTGSMYKRIIMTTLASLNITGVSATHIEAWMRMAHGELHTLCLPEFQVAVRVALRCIQRSSQKANDNLVQLMGLAAPV